MHKYCLLFIVFLIIFGLSYAKEPENLTLLKQTIVRYHDSGAYEQDISNSINRAKIYLQKRLAENNINKNKKQLAIVFDIDETSISNYSRMKKDDFGSTPKNIMHELSATNYPAIPETLSLYKFARLNEVAIFFITGRGNNMRNTTNKELKHAGFSKWNKLYMCNTVNTHCKTIPFKSSIRKEIIDMGYDIVLNIGDQYSDLKGGYADYKVKLPNPYYYVP